MDKFYVYVSDFFDDLNNEQSNICFYEFSSNNINNILNLKKSIIKKHVYNKVEKGYVKLIIENI